jgi:hypothetical protein
MEILSAPDLRTALRVVDLASRRRGLHVLDSD